MRRGFNSILRSKAKTCGGIYTANEIGLYLENYINCKISKNLTIIINILAFKIARQNTHKMEKLGSQNIAKKRVVQVAKPLTQNTIVIIRLKFFNKNLHSKKCKI